MTSEAREALEERVQKAILQESVFRWESALVISMTLVLATISALGGLGPGLQNWWWAWLAGGGLAEAVLIYSSLTDAEFGQRVAANLLRHEFRPEALHDERLQSQMTEALEYRSRIEEALRGQGESLIKEEMAQTGQQIDEWLEHIYHMAQRIDRYRRDAEVLARDRERAAVRIRQLEKDLSQEDDSAVRQQIEDTVSGLRRQVDTLERLANTIQRAELQLENTLTSLRTIYSQTMLVEAKDIDSSRARRLRHEISEEVTELNDVLLAMDEVYAAESAF